VALYVTRTRTCCVSSSLLRRLTPQHFHTLWGQTAANLQAALAERSDAEIGLAHRQIAIGEASLPLPLSAYTEFDDDQSPASGIESIGTIRRGRKGRPVTPAAARRPATANRSNRSLGPQRRGGATGEPERSQPRDLRRPHAGMESTSPGNGNGLAQLPAIPPSWRSASALHPIRVNREPADIDDIRAEAADLRAVVDDPASPPLRPARERQRLDRLQATIAEHERGRNGNEDRS
jgi:hypothetical protein